MTAERSYLTGVPSSARVLRVPLGMDKSPAAVLRATARDARPFALVGAWAGGLSVVGSDPLVVIDGASDPFAVVDEQPVITDPLPDAVGGGWVGYLGYDLGRLIERLPQPLRRPIALPSSTLAFYDHLLVR